MAGILKFSEFKAEEFTQIAELLCSVFVTSTAELSSLYTELTLDFEKDGWPSPHFMRRSFFQSQDRGFQQAYSLSPVVAVDLPSILELDDGFENKPTIAIVGQDSKCDQAYEEIIIGTPYALHLKSCREVLKRTKLYFDMVRVLFGLGYRVYLTDVYKIWVCNPNRPYYGVALPKSDQEIFFGILKQEILAINANAVFTWGKESGRSVSELNLSVPHLNFPHPSGAANHAWKKMMNKSPTHANKLKFWEETIFNSLS